MGTLSGGEKRRVALCRSIVSNPDFLILDEPTNHLDTDSIEWMAQYLKKFRGAFLVATHDRYFLDEICNHIVELQAGRFHTHKGNYSDYLESNLARMENEQAIELKRKRFLHRETFSGTAPSTRSSRCRDGWSARRESVNRDWRRSSDKGQPAAFRHRTMCPSTGPRRECSNASWPSRFVSRCSTHRRRRFVAPVQSAGSSRQAATRIRRVG